MKINTFHSKWIRIVTIPVIFLITVSILSAQKNIVRNDFYESVSQFKNYWGNFPDNRVPEMFVTDLSNLPGIDINEENLLKRDSVYTYLFVSGNDSSLRQKKIFFYNMNGQIVSTLTSSRDNKEQLWIYEDKQEYVYDDFGYINSISNYQYLGELWQIVSLRELAHDSIGNLLMDAYYFYDPSEGELVGTHKLTSSYYSNALVKSNSLYNWDIDKKTWLKKDRSDYMYNDHALLDTMIIFKGDESGSNWIHFTKKVFKYNEAGQYTSGLIYQYSEGGEVWALDRMDSTFYDTINYTEEYVTYRMNSSQTEWIYFFKNVKTCLTADENHCEEINYFWNTEENAWMLTGDSHKDIRDKVLFSSGGFWMSRFIFDWESISAHWKPSGFGYTQSYDAAGHRTSFTPYAPAIINDNVLASPGFFDTASYNQEGSLTWKASYNNWNQDLSKWETGNKTDYYYVQDQLSYSASWKMENSNNWFRDSSSVYYTSEFVLPENHIYSSNDTLYAVPESAGSYQWFDCTSGEEITDANKNWYYSGISGTYGVRITKDNYIFSTNCYDFVVAVSNTENKLFRCYPNPANKILHLEFYQPALSRLTCTLTSLAGKQQRNFSVPDHSLYFNLDLSGLSPGIYFLQVWDGSRVLQRQKVSIIFTW